MNKLRILMCAVILAAGSTALAQEAAVQQTAVQNASAELSSLMKREALYSSLGDDEGWRREVLAHPKSGDAAVQRYLDRAVRYDRNVRGLPETKMPGAITSFYVSFPFECPSLLDFGNDFGPEAAGFDTSKPLAGAMAPALNWMLYESVGNLSVIRPQERVYNPGFAAMYLASNLVIEAEKPIRAVLEIPSEMPIAAWLNGDRVVDAPFYGPENVPLYAPRTEIVLNPGENTLVIKTAALERQPGFYVFLSDAETGLPLDVRVDNSKPIVFDAPLGKVVSAKMNDAVYSGFLKDPNVPVSDRAWMARQMLAPEDAVREINSLLLTDIDAAAALPTRDIEIAILALNDPGKTLQILNKAVAKRPDDRRLALLYARQMMLNSEAQGDAGSRFVDEWPVIRTVLAEKNPVYDGISYEPLRSKMAALAELNAQQAMTALRGMDFESCPSCVTSSLSLAAAHLETRGKIGEYRQVMDKLYALQKNSSTYLTERLDRMIRRAVSTNDEAELAQTLAVVQREVEAFFELHPYDDFMWSFWLDITAAYGLDKKGLSAETIRLRSDAGFTADADGWFLLYLSQRMNDPARWIRYARHGIETGDRAEIASAYEMASQLMPQNETLAELSRAMKRLAEPQKDSAAADDDTSYEKPYIVEDIPGSANPGAAQVVSLLDNRVVRILPSGLASTFSQIAFEVMDEQGLRMVRAMPINYAPTDEKLEILSVTTTKKDGTVRRLYKKQEYNTADESIRMYYDQRQVVIEVPDLAVGDRIEYRFKRTQMQRSASSAAYFSDLFQLRTTFDRQWSRYTVIAPESMPVRLYRHDPAGKSGFVGTEKKDSGSVVTTYEEKNTPRFLVEDRMPGITEIVPFLLVSSFETWQDIADWFLDLARPQWKADDAIKQKVAELTSGLADPLEKLKRIHAFVLKSTRYVALEFGIHGHKPYPASQIFERRFGDCKDKASLLKVMLEEAGIETHFVLIRTRQNGDIKMEQPNAYLFDHAIVYVPQFDLFLDGTAEFSGTGELPPVDQDAWAFIVHEDGKYDLRKTPLMPAESNLTRHEWTFDLTGGDRVPYTNHVLYKGLMAPSYRERYQVESLRRERLESEYAYSVPGTNIESFEFSDLTDLETDVTVSVKASTAFSEIAKKDGTGWNIRPGVMLSEAGKSFAPTASRKLPLLIFVPITMDQTIQLILPDGARAVLPSEMSEKSKFGQWSMSARQAGNIVTVKIDMSIAASSVQPADYPAFQDFLQKFDRAVNTQYRIETTKE